MWSDDHLGDVHNDYSRAESTLLSIETKDLLLVLSAVLDHDLFQLRESFQDQYNLQILPQYRSGPINFSHTRYRS